MTPNAIIRYTTKWPWNPLSLGVGWLGGSKEFSHCMLIVDGMAFQSVMLGGCQELPLLDAMHGVASLQDMPVYVPNLLRAVRFGREQVQRRRGYDYAGALGIPFLQSDNWEDDAKWWCSEFVFAMLMAGDLTLLDPAIVKRVTPEHIRQCNYKKSPIIRLREIP